MVKEKMQSQLIAYTTIRTISIRNAGLHGVLQYCIVGFRWDGRIPLASTVSVWRTVARCLIGQCLSPTIYLHAERELMPSIDADGDFNHAGNS